MKKEFKQVNTTKLMDEFISNGIRVIKADIADETTSIFEFEENQDIELIEKIYKEHNPEEEKDKTEIELLQEEVLEQSEYMVEMDYRLINLELGL